MQMGREKRDKGKATVLEPPQKKKRSREKREHDAAERVADAFDAMQSRHARGISIEEPRQNPPRSTCTSTTSSSHIQGTHQACYFS